MSLLRCIEGLYADQVQPTLQEVQRSLRAAGWARRSVQKVLQSALATPTVFQVSSPGKDKAVSIFLQSEPPSFRGWACLEVGVQAWQEFEQYLNQQNPTLQGGLLAAADELGKMDMPPFKSLTLGEIREMLRQAVAKKLLVYVGQDLQPGQRET
eukprot:1567251-Amphidinium_carterae.1